MSEQATSTSPDREGGQGVEYGRFYYRHDCGVPYERNDHWLRFFAGVADGIVRELRPASVLDAGCAMGFLVEALRERGVDASGVDVSEFAISQVDESAREHCSVASLTEPLPRRYDLVVCIEVLEHIPAADAGKAIANICAATDRLLLSSTPDDYSEASHLNVQPPEAWSEALAREGFVREVERDASFATPWAAIYSRTSEELPEIVRRYDRSWARQRREADQLRDSLLASQGRLAELEEQAAAGTPEQAEEIARQQQEILRLRDLMVGMEMELGKAKGRLAELEEGPKRLLNAKARVEALVPGLSRVKSVLVRLLGGRAH